MKLSIYTPVYALTLLISATLLFSVQPMFSKMILPLLGGTSQVWNTAMLFFQIALLAGYAYAHGTTRFLPIKYQAILHVIVLSCFISVLPFAIPEGWTPPEANDPTFWQLSLMSITVGGPFFALAASAPMLQRWFAQTDHPDAHDPYFLYGASNLGSMSSLLLYPVLIEPLLSLNGQFNVWMYGYFSLIGLFIISAALVWPHLKKNVDTNIGNDSPSEQAPSVSWSLRLQWLVLAFIPSSLMLGVTSHITMDIASAPLIWIIPLALYVGTFIIVFARKQYLSLIQLSTIHAVLITILCFLKLSNATENFLFVISIHVLAFFFTAWLCHAVLAAKRPHNSHLTEFYLLMSLGGAMGGFFNAIIAPQVFVTTFEYPLILAAACVCRYWCLPSTSKFFQKIDIKNSTTPIWIAATFILAIIAVFYKDNIALGSIITSIILSGVLLLNFKRPILFSTLVAISLFVGYNQYSLKASNNYIHKERNFFGIIAIVDSEELGTRNFLHGTTNHGTQALDSKHEFSRLSYYSENSPINDVFSYINQYDREQHIAVAGLGAGVTACFSKDGRDFDFYEIDPAVVRIAENPDFFTYLSDCGSPYEMHLGDARIKMKKAYDKKYDVIFIDVFSSDNIPIHILTLEAIEMYLSKLKDDGILVFNISNRYLDLEPVIAATAKELGLSAYGHLSESGYLDGDKLPYNSAHYAAITKSQSAIKYLKEHQWSTVIEREGIVSWSDEYSNILSVLSNKSAIYRFKLAEKQKQKEQNKKNIEIHNAQDNETPTNSTESSE